MLIDLGRSTTIESKEIIAWWPAHWLGTPSLFLEKAANPLPPEKSRMMIQLRSGSLITTYHTEAWLKKKVQDALDD